MAHRESEILIGVSKALVATADDFKNRSKRDMDSHTLQNESRFIIGTMVALNDKINESAARHRRARVQMETT